MTLRNLYDYAKSQLADCYSDYASKTLLIFDRTLHTDRVRLSIEADREVTAEEQDLILNIISRCKSGYPLQYLLGSTSFYGRDFCVGEGVLIPRFDTEALIDCAIAELRGTKSPTIIDLCSGSGAIAITLGLEIPDSTVYAVEMYDDAIKWLKLNQKNLNSNVNVIQSDVLQGVPEQIENLKFDMIISNPPYIDFDSMQSLPTDVTHEPQNALFGGNDGLEFYRGITNLWKNNLKSGGKLLFEIGFDQKQSVSQILLQNGFCDVNCQKDLSNNNRVIFGTTK